MVDKEDIKLFLQAFKEADLLLIFKKIEPKSDINTKKGIIKFLLENKSNESTEIFNLYETLKGANKNKLLDSVYRLSSETGNQIESLSKYGKKTIFAYILSDGLSDQIPLLAEIAKLTRSRNYKPYSFEGKIKKEFVKDKAKVKAVINEIISKFNRGRRRKIGLKQYIYAEKENKSIISLFEEYGKRVYRQLPFRGREIVTVYPVAEKVIEFNYNKSEYYSNFKDEELIVQILKVFVTLKNDEVKEVEFFQAEDKEEFSKEISRRAEKEIKQLEKEGDVVASREIHILKNLDFKRIQIHFKNVNLPGNPQNIDLMADDVDKAFESLGVSNEKKKELFEKSEDWDFSIKYKDAVIKVYRKMIHLSKGTVSDLELELLIRILRKDYV